MKLKKIASLMLAGIMAVSMLAGCKSGTTPDDGNTDVKPVDSSFATAVNNELSDEYKALVTFGSDSALASAVNKVAASTEFGTANLGWMTGSVAETFRELLNIDANNRFAVDCFKNATKEKTVADLIIVDGALTESGLAKAVADELEKYDSRDYFPLNGVGQTYDYDYAGNIAVTKVTVLNGTGSYYVVGMTITMTPTKVAQ